ncbi:zinc finger CCHC domain-containing protein 7-like [Phymastichus coffea]|uniref:zinc finger CCHC domain-containing protein 7-like n=1 Tax=Phymastichus coffea TaxID=108790 RepID=UPI00273AEC34|nr:zinc finger CCHC domain-containing protein 7-like [Phymastichus coffea]
MIPKPIEGNLVKLIRSKLEGEARDTVIGINFGTLDELLEHLADIFGSAQTLNQLLGELGNEFQHDDEKVLTFANRLRLLSTKIIDAKRKIDGIESVTNEYKHALEENIFECFKRGLKSEIKLNLSPGVTPTNILKLAIKAEKDLEIQSVLRSGFKNKVSSSKIINLCQLCNKEGHEALNCLNITKPLGKQCTYCKKSGHEIKDCFLKKGNDNIICQICDKKGHNARECKSQLKCQICNKIGHIAKTCTHRAQVNTINEIVCQLCNRVGHTGKQCQNNSEIESASNKNPTFDKSNIICFYCKRPGHMIAECIKRKVNEARNQNQGNGSWSPQSSAMQRTNTPRMRQSNEDSEMLLSLVP